MLSDRRGILVLCPIPTLRASRFSVRVLLPLDGCQLWLMGGHLSGFRINIFLLLDGLPTQATSPIYPKQAGFWAPETCPCTSKICQSSPTMDMLLAELGQESLKGPRA